VIDDRSGWRGEPAASSLERAHVPPEVTELACRHALEVLTGAPAVLELWAERGQMLLDAKRALGARRALALVSGGCAVPDALRTAPEVHLGRMPDDADLDRNGVPASFDVTVGAAPWRWAPARARVDAPGGQSVELWDDPATVAILRACMAMPDHGIGLFVVGLGALARRGPGSVVVNLPRFGVHVWSVDALPARMFVPASSPGRVLVALRRQPVARRRSSGRARPGASRSALPQSAA
jgi:hypothetical protein